MAKAAGVCKHNPIRKRTKHLAYSSKKNLFLCLFNRQVNRRRTAAKQRMKIQRCVTTTAL